jgi:hypothetical protein
MSTICRGRKSFLHFHRIDHVAEQVREGIMSICIQKVQISRQITDYFLSFYVTLNPGAFRGRRTILKQVHHIRLLPHSHVCTIHEQLSTFFNAAGCNLNAVNSPSTTFPHPITMNNTTNYTTNTWNMGSIPTKGMDICLESFFCSSVVLCRLMPCAGPISDQECYQLSINRNTVFGF